MTGDAESAGTSMGMSNVRSIPRCAAVGIGSRAATARAMGGVTPDDAKAREGAPDAAVEAASGDVKEGPSGNAKASDDDGAKPGDAKMLEGAKAPGSHALVGWPAATEPSTGAPSVPTADERAALVENAASSMFETGVWMTPRRSASTWSSCASAR